MRYLDRKGEFITSFQWHRLYADPKYAIVETTKIGKRLIETSWVGMIPDCEKDTPKLYLVQLLRSVSVLETESDSKDSKELACQWYATEAEARRGHQMLVDREQTRQYGRPAK
jgi:hypothetical protein